MRAITITRFGGPESLELTDLPDPRPGPGQVSIDVAAASVTLADVLMRRGAFGGDPPIVPGLEVAGTIRALGPDVTGLTVGQPVVTLSRPTAGGYAEISLASSGITIPIGDLDPATAVVTVPNTATALLALTDVAPLPKDGRVLVHGALGALGSISAAVARSLGAARVDGTVRRAEQVDAAREAGFDHVLLSADTTERYDVILDPVGGPLRRASLELLTPLGRLVALGNASDDDNTLDTTDLWLGNTAVAGLNAGALFGADSNRARHFGKRAVELAAEGAVKVAYRRLVLDQAREAHESLEAGSRRERLILDPTAAA